MTEQKFVGRPLSKSYFELYSCIYFVDSVFMYLLSHMGKFLHAAEAISQVTK